MKPSICNSCDMEAKMYEGNKGFCYQHAGNHADEEGEKQSIEINYKISSIEMIKRAKKENIEYMAAGEQLLNEQKEAD